MCTAKILAHAPVAANTLRVSVTDELTGRPVDGALVMVTDVVTGASIGGVADQTTGNDGTVQFNIGGGGVGNSVTISVFHTDFNYLTIAGYDRTGTASRDLSASSAVTPTTNYGGYKGTFNNVPGHAEHQSRHRRHVDRGLGDGPVDQPAARPD